MPHLLNVWPTVSKDLRNASSLLLLFDYDGTLAPIVARPDLAVLPLETRDLLTRLSSCDRYILGVVSGRSLADVRERVGVPDLVYAGNHGLEIEGPGVRFLHPQAEDLKNVINQVYEQLRRQIADYAGVIIEHKGLTLSVHYRLTPEDLARQVDAAFRTVVSTFQESAPIKITRGKKVLEVRPDVPWDKGKAIARLQETFPQATLTMFFGDDLTDEDGFNVVQEAGGIAVFVGPARQPTRALYRVDSPQEVAQTLRLVSQFC
jgi:trehalose 6-phosphate phosphatase